MVHELVRERIAAQVSSILWGRSFMQLLQKPTCGPRTCLELLIRVNTFHFLTTGCFHHMAGRSTIFQASPGAISCALAEFHHAPAQLFLWMRAKIDEYSWWMLMMLVHAKNHYLTAGIAEAEHSTMTRHCNIILLQYIPPVKLVPTKALSSSGICLGLGTYAAGKDLHKMYSFSVSNIEILGARWQFQQRSRRKWWSMRPFLMLICYVAWLHLPLGVWGQLGPSRWSVDYDGSWGQIIEGPFQKRLLSVGARRAGPTSARPRSLGPGCLE